MGLQVFGQVDKKCKGIGEQPAHPHLIFLQVPPPGTQVSMIVFVMITVFDQFWSWHPS